MWPQYYFFSLYIFCLFVYSVKIIIQCYRLTKNEDVIAKLFGNIFIFLMSIFSLYALRTGGFCAVWGW